MKKQQYLQILARLRSLAYDDSPLLTMRERYDVLGWTRAGSRGKAKKLWALVQERQG